MLRNTPELAGKMTGPVYDPAYDTGPLARLLQAAFELCDAETGEIWLDEDGRPVPVVQIGEAEAAARPGVAGQDGPGNALPRGSGAGLAETVAPADTAAARLEAGVTAQGRSEEGAGTVLWVPIDCETRPRGLMRLDRRAARAFTDREIGAAEVLAGSIATLIDGAAGQRDTGAALVAAQEQLAATREILRIIAASPIDLGQVLDTLVRSAGHLCDAYDTTVFIRRGDRLFVDAHCGPIPVDFESLPLDRTSVSGRSVMDGALVHVEDLSRETADFPLGQELAERLGHRTIICAPLMRAGAAVGTICVRRDVVKPFDDREIDLIRNFADQAVIAIENARLFEEVATRTSELAESLDQQTATADVLKAIGRSALDLKAVLQTLVESAARICAADMGTITREIDGRFHRSEFYGFSEDYIADARTRPVELDRSTASSRALLDGHFVHIPDVEADPGYHWSGIGGFRTVLAVPILHEGATVGVLLLLRATVSPFTERQIELVSTFADQAAIAIENAKLFEAVNARTRDLTAALERQTATAEVLKVISGAAFDLDRIFATVIETAARLSGADLALIFRPAPDGETFRVVADYGVTPALRAFSQAQTFRPEMGSLAGRTLLKRATVHIPDVLADPEYTFVESVEVGGFRANLGVPLFRNDELVGVMALARRVPEPFAPEQVSLVETFADQVVIAIENARLFDEVTARSRDLAEALEQQTATAEVLRIIATSAADIQPVLDAVAEYSCRLCDVADAVIMLRDGDEVVMRAHYGDIPATETMMRMPLSGATVTGRSIVEGRTIQTEDIRAERARYPLGVKISEEADFRTVIAVPLMRGGEAIGAFSLRRTEVRPLGEKQIALLETFADQSVIAIENARLLNELRSSLKLQTATANVLQTISRSAFELQTVLDTLVRSAAELCEAGQAVILQREGDAFHWVSSTGFTTDAVAHAAQHRFRAGTNSVASRVALSGRTEQVEDVLADPDYLATDLQRLGQYRSIAGVPLLREGAPVGVFVLTRKEVRPFSEKQIETVTAFADQAVIAMENARLFQELQARTEALARSLDELRNAQDRLVQTEKLASLGQLTAGIAHEIKNPLNFVNNFSALSRDLIEELTDLLDKAALPEDLAGEVAELTGLLTGNLAKVEEHGKRADSIVKNMLMHSREGSGEHREVDVNAMVEEALNLAYHGARAERPGFNVTIEKDFDAAAGMADLYPQEITRVLLNLISNGFYATAKRAREDGAGFDPVLSAATRDRDGAIEIVIRDNGTGIPPEVRERMFNPFFTTKPVGEGTGLGLSLSHDIVVKQHGGSIEVDTAPGSHTEFRIRLPRRLAVAPKGASA